MSEKIQEKINAKVGVRAKLDVKVTTLEQTLVTYEQALDKHKGDRERTQAQIDAMAVVADECEGYEKELDTVKAQLGALIKAAMSKPFVPKAYGEPEDPEDPEITELKRRKAELEDSIANCETRVNKVYYGKAGL